MRLIDADALKERIGKICDKAKEEYEHTSLTRLTWIFQGLKNALFTEIDNEPTVQTKRGEIFLAICRKTEYTDSMWKDTIDWHIFGTQGRKMKVMSRVVAWMPQPEPWKPNF